MELSNSSLSICTFNCRSMKSSIMELYDLCSKYDVLLLQEHWLLPNELSCLNNIHPDFLAFGQSAVDLASGVIVGRPYGGTAILYRKSLSDRVTRLHTDNHRVTAISLESVIGPVMVACVYMPTDYGNADCLEKFIGTCATITALFQESNGVQLIVAGDFNCQYGSQYYGSLTNFIANNKLIFSDQARLTDAFTFCSEACGSCTWIDHFLCSKDVDNLVDDCKVLYDYITSDHKPLMMTFRNLTTSKLCGVSDTTAGVSTARATVADWSRADEYSILEYQNELDRLLYCISAPPLSALEQANRSDCSKLIDGYYDNIMACLNLAALHCIPRRTLGSNHCEYVVPGWNELVKDKHKLAREAYLQWLYAGKPHHGPLHFSMNRTRAQFKLALRYCKQHEEVISADLAANSLASKNYNSFWKTIRKQNNGNATKYAQVIDGCTGDEAIAERWRLHFHQIYNANMDAVSKLDVYNKLAVGMVDCELITVSLPDVIDACNKQKKGKAPGPDGIHMESILYGGLRLRVHLCLLFNLFIRYGYLPNSFMQSVMLPLVKNKCGDLADLNNYRAIALSSALSKVLESVICAHLYTDSDVDCFQFGFKPGHSTSLCTKVLKQTVDYYTNHGSHVFACFIDFSKAFDCVNYWKLFAKLIDDGVNCCIVKLLANWYSNQYSHVRWGNSVSSTFSIGNGVRQGGVLSPYLFTRYIRDMIRMVVRSNVGCIIDRQIINLLAYADDLVVIAPSWRALQFLLSIIHSQVKALDMTCNTKKTVCMVFRPARKERIVSSEFPLFRIGDSSIQYVDHFKYLGHFITNDMSDDKDIQREVQNMFIRTNVLMRRFHKCSRAVKIVLFKAYCLCMYDVGLWSNFKLGSLDKLQSCYNKCVKIFFGFRRRDSLTGVLLATGLPSFSTVVCNSRHILSNRWSSSNNRLIRILCDISS